MRANCRGLVSIALFAFWAAWPARAITIQPKYEADHQRLASSAGQTVRPESSDERIADYTEWRAFFTAALVVVSTVQIGFLIRTDRTARITADAAKQSAEVAERALDQTTAPYLDIVMNIKAIIHRFLGGGARINPTDSSVFAEYIIHNYGQSPAVILEIYQYCICSAGFPSEVIFPPPQTNLKKTHVIGGMMESVPFPIGYPVRSADDENEAIWVGLQIRYRDVFRRQYLANYCAAFNRHSATFTAYGGKKYNDRRKLTDDELKIAEARDE